MDFSEIKTYLQSQGLNPYKDFSIDNDTNVVELYVNNAYFCSVSEYDNHTFEVYELGHGEERNAKGDLLKDGELWQYRVYKSLKRTLDFAVKCWKSGDLPTEPCYVW